MKHYDRQDPRVAVVEGALLEVLAKHDNTKLAAYFTEDATILINQKELRGIVQIAQRLQWIKENLQDVKVVIKTIFFAGDQGFDHHISTFTNEQGGQTVYKIFAYIELRDGKISRYEDVTIALNEEPEVLFAATATSQ